jgi:hypothetical protein
MERVALGRRWSRMVTFSTFVRHPCVTVGGLTWRLLRFFGVRPSPAKPTPGLEPGAPSRERAPVEPTTDEDPAAPEVDVTHSSAIASPILG